MENFDTHLLLTDSKIRQKRLALLYIFANPFKALCDRKQPASQTYFCIQSDALSHIKYLWKTPLFTHKRMRVKKGSSE